MGLQFHRNHNQHGLLRTQGVEDVYRFSAQRDSSSCKLNGAVLLNGDDFRLRLEIMELTFLVPNRQI